MPTMKNPETGETMEMPMEELMEAMREGKVSIQQQVHNADGTVTSSTVYGNEIGDGIDRSMNVFGAMGDIFKPALQMAKRIKEGDENAENLFFMDDSDVDYEVTIDDTSMPIMHIVSCTKESVSVSRYTRDERKTVGEPISNVNILFENGEIKATLEEVQENYLVLFAFGVHELRQILRERGILQELQRIGNKSSGVLITAASEEDIDARIVRGKARPDLPCMMFGGLFAQGLEDAVMMRPYVDELMTGAMYDNMSLEEKIEAAEDGDTDLMEELAMYYLDECDEPDAEKAVYWFKKMADAGIPTAMFSLGLHYAKGFGVERSFENAVYWMEKAANNGDEDAPALIEKFNKAIIAEKTVHAGDAQAQAVLAEVYMFMGNSLDQADPDEDYAIAFEYAQLSATQNNGDGIWTLALAYEHGRGVVEDIDKAIELYRKGADLGHAPSQHSLACYLMRGDYLDADPETAFALFEKSALQGYKLAEFSLCKMYELGEGTEQDLDKAIEWGEKAATGGDANTQYEVAKLYTYTNDDGEMIDADRAKYWYSQAAEKGHEMAAGALRFGSMWGDMEGFEDSDEDLDEGDEENTETNEELKVQAKEFMATVIANDNGSIKNLLTNTGRNCLSAACGNAGNADFDKLCEEGYLLFDIEDIDWETAKDCFIVLSKEESASFFGTSDTQYVFNIICKMCVNDLEGYKTRALELCSSLSNMLNGYEIGDDEKLFYMMCQSQLLSDQYGITSIYFTNNSIYSSNEGTNVFADYDKDSCAVFEHLFEDKAIKESIMGMSKSVQEAYEDGHIQLTENFADNDKKDYSAWLILTWDFSFDTSIYIVPVVRNKKQLKPLVSAIKKKLNNFELPVRGTLNYAADVSQEKVDLSDKLVAAMLKFK